MNPCLAILAVVLGVSAQRAVTKPILQANPPVAPAPASQDASSATQTTAPKAVDQDQAKDIAPQADSTRPPEASSSTSYIIGPEDSLQISVWKEPGLSGNLPVRPDGMISLSLIGDIPAAGLTPVTLAINITERLRKYVKEPNVNVVVASFHPKQVYLLGEVQHVGPLVITPEMTPLQAISAAGGLSAFANAKHIYILRTVQGKQTKIPFDYKKALKSGNQQGVTLVPGDTIVVP